MGDSAGEIVRIFTKPEEVIDSIKRVITTPDLWMQALGQMIASSFHLDDLGGLAEGIMSGDEEKMGYRVGRLIVAIGIDVGLAILTGGAAAIAGKIATRGALGRPLVW